MNLHLSSCLYLSQSEFFSNNEGDDDEQTQNERLSCNHSNSLRAKNFVILSVGSVVECLEYSTNYFKNSLHLICSLTQFPFKELESGQENQKQQVMATDKLTKKITI